MSLSIPPSNAEPGDGQTQLNELHAVEPQPRALLTRYKEEYILRIIPAVKEFNIDNGFLRKKTLCYPKNGYDARLLRALEHLPYDEAGIPLHLCVGNETGEQYEIHICENEVRIHSDSAAGAFYAIQTLRQIFAHDQIPCAHIRDWPDFPYRGFYHDVTRGKVPTLESLKALVDRMAAYKLNSLQLYVEHTFEFRQFRELNKLTGYLTADEIRELDRYCRENFIDFIPSLSTFGHLFELLEHEQYRHLRVLKDYTCDPNLWRDRMRHHTIDPREPESFDLIKDLIDQYLPLFGSEYFNICCDETFDLKQCGLSAEEEGRLYVEFVQKIIAHVRSRGKKIMMWGDILLQHPWAIEQLPEETVFLNWYYRASPPEENVIRFAQARRSQIVCPGTNTWHRFCENVQVEEQNICRMAQYGHRHGASGVLNTNWGDWGNLASLELALYGLVLGAEVSWSVNSQPDDAFCREVSTRIYHNEQGVQFLRELSRLNSQVSWRFLCRHYFGTSIDGTFPPVCTCEIKQMQDDYTAFVQRLAEQSQFNEEIRQEMLLAAQGVCLMAELYEQAKGTQFHRLIDTKQWLTGYRSKWLQKNKESELYRIESLFLNCEEKGLPLQSI